MYKNGTAEGKPVALSAGNNWKVTFSNLPDKDSNGNLISYSVKEVKVPAYYTVDKEESEFVDGKATITNKRTPETTEVTVKKVWDDAKNQDGLRPTTITVHLLANGEKVQTATVSGEGETWSHTFTNLPVYKNGQKIIYTVTEDTVANYTATIDGTTITNTYKPGKTSLTVTKKWDDAENQDGLRPKTIKVQLYADGQKLGKEVELSEDNKWSYTFSDLDEKKDGKTIQYTVKETKVPEGYTQTVEATNPGQVVISNTHTPSKTRVKVTKKWDDANNQDGIRPASITVRLYKDGAPTDQTLELSEANKWYGTFENLDVNAAGKALNYTVKEENVPEGYTLSIDDKDPAYLVLTNKHEPNVTQVQVTKKWDDGDDKDGLRPKTIKVQLYADGKKAGEVVELSADNKWTYTFTDLVEKANGKAISYTVEEVDVPEGYQVSKIDNGKGNVVLTNKHEPSIPPTTTTEEPKKKIELPNTGSTESILSLILALTGVSIAAYLLRKKKD